MSTPTIDLNVKNYIAAVRAELDDIDADVREDLLEDLESHLHEVAAEGDGTLEERLGPPSAYAAELRTSAGLPSRGERVGFVRRVRDRVDAFTSRPGYDRITRFANEMRPGWWLLRAYLFVEAADIVFTHASITQLPLPSFGGNWFFGILAVIAFGILSIELGRAAERSRWARRFSLVVSAVIVVMTFGAAQTVRGLGGAYEGPSVGYEMDPALRHADGSPIANVCPYAVDGKPLDRVLLFDQDGRPITNVAVAQDPFRGIANAYPREGQIADPMTGELKPTQCPTLRRTQPTSAPPSAPPSADPLRELPASPAG
jgi:hypothetical protein